MQPATPGILEDMAQTASEERLPAFARVVRELMKGQTVEQAAQKTGLPASYLVEARRGRITNPGFDKIVALSNLLDSMDPSHLVDILWKEWLEDEWNARHQGSSTDAAAPMPETLAGRVASLERRMRAIEESLGLQGPPDPPLPVE